MFLIDAKPCRLRPGVPGSALFVTAGLGAGLGCRARRARARAAPEAARLVCGPTSLYREKHEKHRRI